MTLYSVIVEEAQWNSELIEANSPQEARAKMEARIDAALTPNGDDTEFDEFGDWLYSGDSDVFIHHVFWVENGKECDDSSERVTRWWRDARWAYAIASQQQETMRELYLPGLSRDMFLLVNQWIDRMEARGQRGR